MKSRRFVVLSLILFIIAISPNISLGDGDFYTLEFQPGFDQAKVIPLGISRNEKYFSFVELFSPYQEFSNMYYKAFARLYIIDVPGNSFAYKSVTVTIEVHNNPLDQDCFSFFEYELLKKLMNETSGLLQKYDINYGVLPVEVSPFIEGDMDISKEQVFHLFNGEMGELASVKLYIREQNPPSLLDIRISSTGIEKVEQILQKDKKTPKWRINAREYRIDKVCFYGNSNKYIIVFIKVIFPSQNGMEDTRYMCVTGKINKVWENSFKWPEEEIY